MKHRSEIVVRMKCLKVAEQHHKYKQCDYDKKLYYTVFRERWDPYDDCPIEETGKLFYLLRKVVNSDPSRLEIVNEIVEEHRKVIIFYNFTYEIELMKESLSRLNATMAEWNGQKHEPIPDCDFWVYFVQYNAGCEGWNCITTDTIIFYSQSYSYRMTVQAAGRIDRMNTPYKDLFYYHLKSASPIDSAIANALRNKKNFNEKTFLG